MVGKDPHRPQGKTKDAESMGAIATSRDAPYQTPSEKEVAEIDGREMQRHGAAASRSAALGQVGGSRPGVESRVKDAIDKSEAREE